MKVVVTEQARSSLLDARNYYNAQMGGLGYEFVQEFVAAVSRIKAHPEAWTLLSKRTRRCLVNRFPYSVIFRLVKSRDEIQIIDLMHYKQKPKY
ncbi:type II toxin-antitoxin system RelE/ParE family toxin [Thiomicrospira sp. ALE5]|uniref:type II toxin-antitoxin system RelE/ParE family toxin n=1 Tax=Thiomicrospira sp. ALE5 TaxID=748650 RepID=UPI0008E0D08A|nr:type II toxin-antitoxin system RelE/ParE family toxin [Thiomicrospira sp. ALE5]SFR49392.1 ParE toxin of type II toxin-antitoxin system, parDE [Thiomicrospira sp. ALE5]